MFMSSFKVKLNKFDIQVTIDIVSLIE